jgi:hypothetical protein
VLLEEFLAGPEGTVTVMPLSALASGPGEDGKRCHYGALPVVVRFHHVDGAYARVAELLRCTAPIRIDVRRFAEGAEFALFDVNMKPVGWMMASYTKPPPPPSPACIRVLGK